MKIEKICTGCGRSSLNPISEQHIACCPDNNYIEMSNNKQTKLYTEEQVIEMIEKSRETGLTAEYFILTTTPIELPSDEEIEEKAVKILFNNTGMLTENHPAITQSIIDLTQWMRDKIKGGNNEQ